MTKYISIMMLISMLIFLASCASDEKKPEPKTYSNETNQAFEMIERGGSYYLKKAPKNTAAPQIENPKRVVRKPVVKEAPKESENFIVDEKINYEEKAPTPTKSTPKTSAKNNAKVDERLVEINQHLAFYCMKHRKDQVHGNDEAKCMKYVNKVKKKCEDKHRLIDSQLLNCIKTGLKK